ncbi:PBSX family phage terminase large subunit [Lacticaseibacillus mingshuiensis]|uniref:PBSX family phage terminase large subunit n=1 Tax=Lacticaseibacillus mingshuiensis TaxID=2799574 RepID=UPI00194E7BBB|nr:PBSX family phage terminase large subunit [Lacticaseibacillus mingshuiensis]
MMPIELEIKDWHKVFNPQFYKRLFDYDTRTEVYYGGASSGKSHGVVQKVIIKAIQPWSHPRRVLWLRKVGKTVRRSIFEDVKQALSYFKLLPYCKVNETNFEIRLPNGAVFLFSGMDDPEKIKSIKAISDVVMEEATDFNLEDYTQLTLRLREPIHKKRQIFLMFNPVSKLNWVYKYFFEQTQPNTKIIQSTYHDNAFLDDDNRQTIQQLEQSNPAYYRIYALGEFATLDKLVYPHFETRRLNATELAAYPSMFGLDFGYVNDPSAFIHIKVDQANKVLYFVEEYVEKGMLNGQIAEAIKQMGYQKEVITADAAEQKSIAEIKRDGVPRIRPAKKGPDSIIQGITFMQQYRLVVDDRCVKLIEELQNYTYIKDKQTGEYTNRPVDSYNHVLDACRYALEEINGRARPKAKVFKNIYI